MYIVVSWAEKRDRWEWTKELPLVLLQLHLISLFLLWLRILHQSSIPLFDNITQNGLARVGEVNKFSHKFVGKFDRGYSFYGVFEGCSFFVFFLSYTSSPKQCVKFIHKLDIWVSSSSLGEDNCHVFHSFPIHSHAHELFPRIKLRREETLILEQKSLKDVVCCETQK